MILLVGAITWFQGGPLLASPGPLSAATPRATRLQGFQSHADFENKCGRCHAPVWGTERMADRCMACHASVAEAIVAGEGLHGRLRDPRNCKTCHTEHQGRQARLTRLDVAGFPHEVDTVGFTLARHQRDFDDSVLKCQQCHTEALSALDQATCIECHAAGQPAFTDPHRADVGDDCLACHDGSGQLTKFDHDEMTGFPLAGEHGEARCEDCHTEKQFKGLDSACTSCHLEDDRHKGQFGASCESCHTPEKWERATFRHDLEQFTFEGRPLDIATNCVTCHRLNDEHKGRFGTECQRCHTPEEWDRVTFDHNETDFPLTGGHAHVECEVCHAEGKFTGLELLCVACHREDDAHEGQYGTSCERCHIADGWDQVIFDHTVAGLMYNGRPLDVATSCVTCHARDDAHEGRFGDACYKCHVADGWDQVTFDHNRTMFPLEGAHREVACEKCHTIERFAFTPMDCVACHAEPRVHLGLLGTQCADCHTVNAWSPALLPEHTFPLNHRSRKNIACDVCHDQGTFELYTCYNCHEHNPAKIERKHLEEGIRNFQDCMRCHPTGREHEGEGHEREGGEDD
ncbi:MAG: hypothetical protein D6791_05035 [Chloroflexi bacterium]|nr:MAG: hypothetical protein D6791_05035 [Chloroflexota bacterium]